MSVPSRRRWHAATLLGLLGAVSASAQDRGAAALGSLVQGIGVSGRVLVIAAHPDDEDTQLITWLTKGRHVETAYLSLTRGDGGQNLLGNELGEALGAIRSEELLAARRVDGGRQFFTRAFDFGFSKSADETFRHWPHDSVLRDVITVIRAFRPHVITSVFSGTPRDGHGHHQAAGILAAEAYQLAGDTVRYPRAATAGFGPWTVLKFYRRPRGDSGTIRMNVGEFDRLMGRSYAELAGESRSQHKSQAFGTLEQKGVRWFELRRMETRVPSPQDPAKERSIFDGVDTSWTRLKGSLRTASIRAALDSLPGALAETRARFDPLTPEAVVPALSRVRRLLERLCSPIGPAGRDSCHQPGIVVPGGSPAPQDAETATMRDVAVRRVDAALALAAGVAVEATADRVLWSLADSVPVRIVTYNRGRRPLKLHGSRTSAFGRQGTITGITGSIDILPDSSRIDVARTAFGPPSDVPHDALDGVARPWWLALPRSGDMFAPPVTGVAEDDESRLAATATVSLSADGTPFDITVPVVYRYADALRGEVNEPIAGAPVISVRLDHDVEYARAGASLERVVRVHLTSAASMSREVDVSLRLPTGLVADSGSRRVTMSGPGVRRIVSFTLRGRLSAGRHAIEAVAVSGGQTFEYGYVAIEYPHIRTLRLYRRARMQLEAVDVALPAATRIGYIAGVGDNAAPGLEQLGIEVVPIDPEQLPAADLSRLAAIVVGPRAYEAHPALIANNQTLLDYVRNGGTAVVQYGQYEMTQPGVMPYPITLARPADRVTVEDSPVRIIDPGLPILAGPNRIVEADFAGWLQDRSLYMPRTFDSRYQPAVELNDPGEPPNRGGILVADYGKGTYVYTTLAFFRQLPNGVPGAARLFVNLLAAHPARAVQ